MALTPQLQEIKDAVATKYATEIAAGDLRIWGGVFSCRPMRPQPAAAEGIAYSEHAWSNAWDLYYGDRPRKYVNRVVRWLRLQKLLGRLPVGSIITYGANGNHVHIEGNPKRNPRPWTNTPPCAGGPTEPDPDEVEMLKHITDQTWAQWYADGHITGEADLMPHYYYNSTTTTPDSDRWHAFNVAQRSMSRNSRETAPADDHTHEVGRTSGPV